MEGWLAGHREACGSAATAASGGAAEATADPPPTLARPPVEPLAENSFDCPICLEILCEPVTLPCGHSFCAACVTDTLAAAAARCPSCRAEVPGRVAGDLRVNRLLEQVVHAKAPAAYDARRAALDAPSPTVSEAGTWVVVVDPLSPASLVVLGLLAVLKAPVTIEREGMLWSDDKRRPEWVKDSLREGVPRLELRGAARNGNWANLLYLSTAPDGAWGVAFPDRMTMFHFNNRDYVLISNAGQPGGAAIVDLADRRIVQCVPCGPGLDTPTYLPLLKSVVAVKVGKLKGRDAEGLTKTYEPGRGLYLFDVAPLAAGGEVALRIVETPGLCFRLDALEPEANNLVAVATGEKQADHFTIFDAATGRIIATEPAFGDIQRTLLRRDDSR